jgi:outer membrane protein OmpA-like peptidoglycan-associated protein
MNAAAEANDKQKSLVVEIVDELRFFFEVGYKVVLLAGILPTVGYLIVSIKFYPTGLTIGDSFFFLMVGLAFGVVYLFFLLYFAVLALVLESVFSAPSTFEKWFFRILVFGIFLAIGVTLFIFRDTESASAIASGLIGFSVSGICFVILTRRLRAPATVLSSSASPPILSPASQKAVNIGLGGMVLFAPVLIASVFLQRMNENMTMKNVGMRATNITLKLSEENYNILTSAASGQYLAALGCTTSSGAPERVVHGVNLLWHGIGERSLVEIPAGEGKPLVVELKRDGVFFFRNYSGVVTRCIEMSSDIFFKSGSSELAEDDSGDLDEMMKVIHKNSASIEEIQVVGHADAFGYKGGAKLNNELALARAVKTRDQIVERACFKNVKAEGHGAREPKTLCKDWPVKETLSECLAVNRRVEIRMKFKPAK